MSDSPREVFEALLKEWASEQECPPGTDAEVEAERAEWLARFDAARARPPVAAGERYLAAMDYLFIHHPVAYDELVVMYGDPRAEAPQGVLSVCSRCGGVGLECKCPTYTPGESKTGDPREHWIE